ncbi:hypothetical protein H2198_001118 [Neophaeococcomyces mojaviensis]|uniref:Uncharacterized protein n=1 Tax=Neophaeococcomyces mojaviensis TaxID=3383035 RepID=A0ACC3AHV8_9EURO|nr:hypothetical protein H2198_001118 [Knufia sp. JES_112]
MSIFFVVIKDKGHCLNGFVKPKPFLITSADHTIAMSPSTHQQFDIHQTWITTWQQHQQGLVLGLENLLITPGLMLALQARSLSYAKHQQQIYPQRLKFTDFIELADYTKLFATMMTEEIINDLEDLDLVDELGDEDIDRDHNQANSASWSAYIAHHPMTADDINCDEHSVDTMPGFAALPQHPLSAPHFSDSDATDWDPDLRRVIERAQSQLEQLDQHLHSPERTNDTTSTISPSRRDPTNARPLDIPPHLSLFLPNPHNSPNIVWRVSDFPPHISEWFSLNLFNHFDGWANLCSLLNEYQDYTQSTIHWRAILEMGKTLLWDAYLFHGHPAPEDGDVRRVTGIEESYQGPSRNQGDFGYCMKVWEFEKQIWKAVMEFGERVRQNKMDGVALEDDERNKEHCEEFRIGLARGDK